MKYIKELCSLVLLASALAANAEPAAEVTADGWRHLRSGGLALFFGSIGLSANVVGSGPTGGLSLFLITSSSLALVGGLSQASVGLALVAAGTSDANVDLGQVNSGLEAAETVISPLGAAALVGGAIIGQSPDAALQTASVAKAASDVALASVKLADAAKGSPKGRDEQMRAAQKLVVAIKSKITAIMKLAQAASPAIGGLTSGHGGAAPLATSAPEQNNPNDGTSKTPVPKQTPQHSTRGGGGTDGAPTGGSREDIGQSVDNFRSAGGRVVDNGTGREFVNREGEGVTLGPMLDGKGDQVAPAEPGYTGGDGNTTGGGGGLSLQMEMEAAAHLHDSEE